MITILQAMAALERLEDENERLHRALSEACRQRDAEEEHSLAWCRLASRALGCEGADIDDAELRRLLAEHLGVPAPEVVPERPPGGNDSAGHPGTGDGTEEARWVGEFGDGDIADYCYDGGHHEPQLS